MSRIGKLPIALPAGVTVAVDSENVVTVKGPKGELKQAVAPSITVKVEDGRVEVLRADNEKENRSLHGLYRALINNMVVGVSEGYKKEMELVGVGYRAQSNGQVLELSLGFSHSVIIKLPAEIKVEAKTERNKNPMITLESYDKQLLGQVCAKIRSLRKPEPYKGKGIRFAGEIVRRKSGKSAGAK
ncbi:MAG: 50S ribosomal protein L6 [Bacteroidaceae bacterium]|nr:50S ribosomal protein L6 [Bacteroidaceae bacterium]MBQ2979634.1 50S ribosomal protein L6 [Bacteroidaceae bacterium]